jgi:hypothetical protein
MQKEKHHFSADVGVPFTSAGVGVSGQIQPNGKYLI